VVVGRGEWCFVVVDRGGASLAIDGCVRHS